MHLALEPCERLRIGVRVAGVVHEDVDAAAGGPREPVEPFAHGLRVGDVADEWVARERRAEGAADVRRGVWTQVVYGDPGARAREGERDLAAEAGAGAGDEGEHPVQVCHAFLPGHCVASRTDV